MELKLAWQLSGPDGIVGTIVGISRNFSIAMSVLNLDFRLSARFRKNSYFGSLSWDGTEPGYSLLLMRYLTMLN